MGCPAKKVCNKAAGSALLRDPELVQAIFQAVTQRVDVPVTVKIRLGWSLTRSMLRKLRVWQKMLGSAW